MKTRLRQALQVVFRGNSEMIDDLITLAMFPYVAGFTYNRVARWRWRRNVKAPASRELPPAIITRLTQSITDYYRTFPGNIPDSRALEVIFTDLDQVGFKNTVWINDRGFETLRNLEKHI
jgi:hypothetical protein